MLGLAGFIKKTKKSISNIENFISAQTHQFKSIKYDDELLFGIHIHTGILKQCENIVFDQYICMVNGEVYNLNELNTIYNTNFSNTPELFINAYKNNYLSNLLANIDGYFSAFVFDKKNNKVLLITDRYGLKPIYFKNKGVFAWASELKFFKIIDDIDYYKNLDLDAINYFIKEGQFIGDRTYFNDVKLLNASTILTYDINSNFSSTERYWKWSNIKQQKISFNDATSELYNNLNNSLSDRIRDKSIEQIGLTLSGGIDSRVLLSLLKDKVPTVTFGTKDCEDYKIARRVAMQNKNQHTLFELNANNWLDGRIRGVWITDGMFNLQHMHSAPFSEQISEIFQININGFAGDLNVGGGWIENINHRIEYKTIKSRFGEISEFIDCNDSFYDLPHEDPFYLDVRVKRFTNLGTIQNSYFFEQIKPFYSNDIMNLLYSIPDEYRQNGKLYHNMIRQFSNNLFENIHTTHSIYPLGKNNDISYKMKLKIRHGFMKIGLLNNYNWNYTDYSNWILTPSFKNLTSTIFNHSLLKDQLFSQKLINIYNYETNKLEGKLLQQFFCYLTAEIWLNQFLGDTNNTFLKL